MEIIDKNGYFGSSESEKVGFVDEELFGFDVRS